MPLGGIQATYMAGDWSKGVTVAFGVVVLVGTSTCWVCWSEAQLFSKQPDCEGDQIVSGFPAAAEAAAEVGE